MSTHDRTSRSSALQRWSVPAVAMGIGLAYLVAGWAGGSLGFGLFGLTVMTVTAVGFVLLARRSETVAGLMDRRDERINRMDADATTVAGLAVIVSVIVGFVVEVARGQDGLPYSALGAIGGVAYIAALVYFRLRR